MCPARAAGVDGASRLSVKANPRAADSNWSPGTSLTPHGVWRHRIGSCRALAPPPPRAPLKGSVSARARRTRACREQRLGPGAACRGEGPAPSRPPSPARRHRPGAPSLGAGAAPPTAAGPRGRCPRRPGEPRGADTAAVPGRGGGRPRP